MMHDIYLTGLFQRDCRFGSVSWLDVLDVTIQQCWSTEWNSLKSLTPSNWTSSQTVTYSCQFYFIITATFVLRWTWLDSSSSILSCCCSGSGMVFFFGPVTQPKPKVPKYWRKFKPLTPAKEDCTQSLCFIYLLPGFRQKCLCGLHTACAVAVLCLWLYLADACMPVFVFIIGEIFMF